MYLIWRLHLGITVTAFKWLAVHSPAKTHHNFQFAKNKTREPVAEDTPLLNLIQSPALEMSYDCTIPTE
jgi:hypothetical protein